MVWVYVVIVTRILLYIRVRKMVHTYHTRSVRCQPCVMQEYTGPEVTLCHAGICGHTITALCHAGIRRYTIVVLCHVGYSGLDMTCIIQGCADIGCEMSYPVGMRGV